MAEKLSTTISKIKNNLANSPKKEYASVQIDFDALFMENALKVCPNFKVSKNTENVKMYFLGLANKKTKKGLYLYGDVGVGKTTMFKIFKSMGRQLYSEYNAKELWFSECNAPGLVNDKMESTTPGYSGNFNYEKYKNGKLYIQDLGMESLCFNKYELMGMLLFERHRNEAITFVDSNLSPKQILQRYGPQVFDRIGEMFHIVRWEGKSLRP